MRMFAVILNSLTVGNFHSTTKNTKICVFIYVFMKLSNMNSHLKNAAGSSFFDIPKCHLTHLFLVCQSIHALAVCYFFNSNKDWGPFDEQKNEANAALYLNGIKSYRTQYLCKKLIDFFALTITKITQ